MWCQEAEDGMELRYLRGGRSGLISSECDMKFEGTEGEGDGGTPLLERGGGNSGLIPSTTAGCGLKPVGEYTGDRDGDG